jgi:hypothetical protein
MKTGSCLCGGVAFEITGSLRPVVACHCSQCRKQTGSFMHATAVAPDLFKLTADQGLRWFRASEWAERGFCSQCGSNLFWKPDHGKHISITAGSIDGETGLQFEGHIFCADKGDYYEVPNNEGYVRQQWES